jgi:hypothetical protein
MVLKPEAQAKLIMPRSDIYFGDEDHGYRMKHKDESVKLKRPPTQSSARLLPYANEPLRQAAQQTMFFP